MSKKRHLGSGSQAECGGRMIRTKEGVESFERIVGCLEMNHGLGEIEAEFP